jgi:hypothetical protein
VCFWLVEFELLGGGSESPGNFWLGRLPLSAVSENQPAVVVVKARQAVKNELELKLPALAVRDEIVGAVPVFDSSPARITNQSVSPSR